MSREARAEYALQGKRDGVLPFEFFVDFLDFIHRNRDLIEVITYADLCWEDDTEYEDHYREEWERWRSRLRDGRVDNSKIYLLIQHDVDNFPERTAQAVNVERSYGVPSNVMIFNESIERVTLAKYGYLRRKAYPVDFELLKKAESEGFVVGYHCNAVERANFDPDAAQEILREDLKELSRHFNVCYFSPHGGVRGPSGESNAAIELPVELRADVKWVHNRHTVRFDGSYSDGGLNGKRIDAESRDPREFIKTLRLGGRYRMLFHPQYYDTPYSETIRLGAARWYQEVIARYGRGESAVDVWPDDLLSVARRSARSKNYRRRLTRFARSFGLGRRMMRESKPTEMSAPIIIGGDGRSGTTLMSVILDSHQNMAIAPEFHFNGKKVPNLGPYVIRCIRAREGVGRERTGAPNREVHEEFTPGIQFVNRVARAGVSPKRLLTLIRRVRRETGTDLETFHDRCALIEHIGRYLCAEKRAHRWGFKNMREIKNLSKYGQVWPQACYIHVIRDGRDVAASQLRAHGSWGYKNIEDAAAGWVNLIRSARHNSHGFKYREVLYEDLVERPEATLRPLVNWLGEQWSSRVLAHNESLHSVLESKVAHPSKAQVAQPINLNSVGRYRTDLSANEIKRFDSVAGELLEELGYSGESITGER